MAKLTWRLWQAQAAKEAANRGAGMSTVTARQYQASKPKLKMPHSSGNHSDN